MKNIIIIFIVFISALSCTTTEVTIPVEEEKLSPADVLSVLPDDAYGAASAKTKPLLCILPFKRSEDNIAAVLSAAAYNNIELNIRITGKYDLSETLPEYLSSESSYSAEEIKAFCFENEIDNTVYGRIEISEGIYTITYHIYETASDYVKYSDSSVIESVLDIFDASDEISDNILSRLSDTPITFGTLDIKADLQESADYQIFLNDVEISLTGSALRLITGSYDFKVIDRITMQTVLSTSVAVREIERAVIELPSAASHPAVKPAGTVLDLFMQHQGYIPQTAEIKIDGKMDDWKEIPPFIVFDDKDPAPSLPGTWCDSVFIAVDNRYVYWLMTFKDGKPESRNDVCYSVKIYLNDTPWPQHISLKLGYWDNSLKYMLLTGPVDRHSGSAYNNLLPGYGSSRDYRTGEGFIEARFPWSALSGYLKPGELYSAEAHIYPESDLMWQKNWLKRWGSSKKHYLVFDQ